MSPNVEMGFDHDEADHKRLLKAEVTWRDIYPWLEAITKIAEETGFSAALPKSGGFQQLRDLGGVPTPDQ